MPVPPQTWRDGHAVGEKCRVGQRFLSEKKIQDAETQLSLENKTMNTTSKHVIKKDVEDKNQEN